MFKIKALSLSQGHPQSSDQKPDFSSSFTKQTQQFLCTSHAYLKGPETKKAKTEEVNRHNICTSYERTINNNTKTEQKIEKYDTHPLSPQANANINEPPPKLSIPTSFAVTTQ